MAEDRGDTLTLLEIKVTRSQFNEIQRLHGGDIVVRRDGTPKITYDRDGAFNFLENPVKMEYAEAVAAVTGMPIETLKSFNFKLKVKEPKRNMFVVMPDGGGKGR